MLAAAGVLTIITLNVDDRHELANSTVHHLYGQKSWEFCTGCEMRTPAVHRPSVCVCGHARRSDVCEKDEPPKSEALAAFERAVRQVDAIICVGLDEKDDLIVSWVRRAIKEYDAASLLLSQDPHAEFADVFETTIQADPTEIRHYLPR